MGEVRAAASLEGTLAAHARQRDAGVHLVPIRHHSPGCARALAALLDEVRPAVVLIEGPREYRALLGALGDERTRPPIAILSTADDGAAFYPLAEYSPEWVALRWGLAHGAVVDFIDASYAAQARDDDPGVRTLQAERHLARSRSIAALATELGCRDHDEVWEHLFEVRAADALADWRTFFADTLAWGALARRDATREHLDADGTHAREAVMAAMLARHAGSSDPVVVVTGAFHTPALLACLEDAPEAAWVRAHPSGDLDAAREAWLVRYDDARLDALRGYGAGMPAPGFWQRAWAARAAGADARAFTVDVVLDVVAHLRGDGHPWGSASVLATAEQALRLAELRGRAWPGRTDVLDALLSCLAKDESGLAGPLADAVAATFTGNALGDLPPGVAAPPLVAEVRREAERLRLTVSDVTVRRVDLDTQRRPAHVRRREFLAKLRFVGSGFARQVGGADLVAGQGAGLLVEQWEYAWTPHVEAALIEAATRAPTLAALVRARVAERADGHRSAAEVATLLAELVVMGEHDALEPVLGRLAATYDTEAHLGSLVASLHTLAGLLAETGRLSLGPAAARVAELVAAGLGACAFQVRPLARIDADAAGPACTVLGSLHALLGRMADADAPPDAVATVRRELRGLLTDAAAPARIHGCLVALAHLDGALTSHDVEAAIAAHLSPGADAERTAGFVLGLLGAAPDVLLHTRELVRALDAALGAMPPDDFLAVLPDLRRAFTFLKPLETHRLASQVAELTGAAASELDAVWSVDPGLGPEALRVERDLVAGLVRDGLAGWGAS